MRGRMGGMKNRSRLVRGAFAILLGGLICLATAVQLYQGKAGRHRVSTPQNDPVGFWLQVVSGLAAGSLITGYGAYQLVHAGD